MVWWLKLGLGRDLDEAREHERVRRRLEDQEARVAALSRMVEVIQRRLNDDATADARG